MLALVDLLLIGRHTELLENIATTQAEYLANAQVRADQGFGPWHEAATHATDALQVFETYGAHYD